MVSETQMGEFTAWAKRRGVIWPSSEIYGGLSNSYDYGPIGVEMKNRLKQLWWRTMVHERRDIVGLDTPIILNRKVWQASGHESNFTDPLIECKYCNARFRQDHLFEENLEIVDSHDFEGGEDFKKLECPNCGHAGSFTAPKNFNLMFSTRIGPAEELDPYDTTDDKVVYLRPETAQGIFINFKQVLDTSRRKIPFGIAQIGKSFRNEITPGNLIFRTREFEQMEMEFFVREEEADKWFQYWISTRLNWYISLGVKKENLRLFKHPKAKLSHYSKGTTDIEYHFPWGWGELEGIANRGDFDLKTHQKYSGKDMAVFDEETKEKFTPWVIEPAGGVDRALLAVMLDAWQFYEKGRKNQGEVETLLAIDKRLAAFDAAVLPLVKKDALVEMAKELVTKLRQEGKNIYYDESGSIGRRYRRQDEIGTPICYTIDFESLEGNTEGTVTVRDRDTMEQKRVKV